MTSDVIGVVDYGMGNLRSVSNALTAVGATHRIFTDPEEVGSYEKILLPGVGAFEQAMAHLRESGLADALRAHVDTGKKLLGVCLGMQLLCERSFEHGIHEGFGWIDAEVKRFPADAGVKVPHMGWNALEFQRRVELVNDVAEGADVYFVHSYFVECADQTDIIAKTNHGIPFASIVSRSNVSGMQFHPEKSQQAGLTLLRNFASSGGHQNYLAVDG